MWILIALIGYLLLATVFLLDKRIVSNLTVSPVVYTFYSTVFLVVLFFLLPFAEISWTPQVWGWAFVSGLGFLLALYTMFRAFQTSEVSHMGPFIGAFITIASFGLGSVWLQENLSLLQQMGIGVLVVASFLLSFEKTASQTTGHWHYLWGVLSGFLFGLSNVAAKAVYESAPFLFGILTTKGLAGILALALLLSPAVRRSLHGNKGKKKPQKTLVVVTVVVNKVLSVVANGLIQYSIALGSVTVVNALGGVQYAFLFLLVWLLSRYKSSFFREYMTKKEISIQVVAIVLFIVGAGFFAF